MQFRGGNAMLDILILGAVIVVAGLFALFSLLPFIPLSEGNGLVADNRH
jgi:hypothetical protein